MPQVGESGDNGDFDRRGQRDLVGGGFGGGFGGGDDGRGGGGGGGGGGLDEPPDDKSFTKSAFYVPPIPTFKVRTTRRQLDSRDHDG